MNHRPDIVMRAEDISMRFPGTLALDSVNYTVYRGKVNVIIGENGAGKSTLMKILAGVQQQTSGQIYLNGQKVSIANTREAAALGIGMVHQETEFIGKPQCGGKYFSWPRNPARLETDQSGSAGTGY